MVIEHIRAVDVGVGPVDDVQRHLHQGVVHRDQAEAMRSIGACRPGLRCKAEPSTMATSSTRWWSLSPIASTSMSKAEYWLKRLQHMAQELVVATHLRLPAAVQVTASMVTSVSLVLRFNFARPRSSLASSTLLGFSFPVYSASPTTASGTPTASSSAMSFMVGHAAGGDDRVRAGRDERSDRRRRRCPCTAPPRRHWCTARPAKGSGFDRSRTSAQGEGRRSSFQPLDLDLASLHVQRQDDPSRVLSASSRSHSGSLMALVPTMTRAAPQSKRYSASRRGTDAAADLHRHLAFADDRPDGLDVIAPGPARRPGR